MPPTANDIVQPSAMLSHQDQGWAKNSLSVFCFVVTSSMRLPFAWNQVLHDPSNPASHYQKKVDSPFQFGASGESQTYFLSKDNFHKDEQVEALVFSFPCIRHPQEQLSSFDEAVLSQANQNQSEGKVMCSFSQLFRTPPIGCQIKWSFCSIQHSLVQSKRFGAVAKHGSTPGNRPGWI